MKPTRLAILSLALLSLSAPALAAKDKPAVCTKRLPYRGSPLFAKPIELPGRDFILGGAFSDSIHARLEAAAQQGATLTAAPAITMAIADQRGFYERPSDKLLYWASVGKAFTATAVLQLVEEGKLRLDDPLSRWFPQFPNAKLITIDDLLLHTAGVFSANEDLVARKEPRYRSPNESVAIAARHGAMFCPGEHWRYSNTGYTMLGEILAQVEGRPYAEVVTQRIVKRLGLTRTRLATLDDAQLDVAPLTPKDGSAPNLNPAWAEAAGSVVASAGDMLRFWHALLTGKLLSIEATTRRFERLYPMFDSGTFYGQGVMVYDVPGLLWLGHSGGTAGAKAVVAYSPSDRAFVAVALNTDGPAEAVANLLLRTLREDPTAQPAPSKSGDSPPR